MKAWTTDASQLSRRLITGRPDGDRAELTAGAPTELNYDGTLVAPAQASNDAITLLTKPDR